MVDDEYGVRSAVRQILEMEGYEVGRAPAPARRLSRSSPPRDFDIALLDYRLPDTDGLALHKQMVANGRQLMTCMITAYADIDLACAATFQGIDFFLPKPFMPDDLLSVVETLVKRKQARAEAGAAAPGARGQPAGPGRGEDPDPLPHLLAARRGAGRSTSTATWCSPTGP